MGQVVSNYRLTLQWFFWLRGLHMFEKIIGSTVGFVIVAAVALSLGTVGLIVVGCGITVATMLVMGAK